MTPVGTRRVGWAELWPEGAASTEWSHSGIAVLDDGGVVFAEPGGAALLVLTVASGEVRRIPTPTEDGHGILHARFEGRELLYLSDPGGGTGFGQVLILDVVTGQTRPIPQPDIPAYAERGWRPTSTALDGDVLWVADGYGESLVHRVSADGATLTLDGAESGTVFSCPHGLVVDTRASSPEIAIADRGNRRIVFFSTEGRFLREVRDDLITSPSCLAVRGAELLVTELDGALLALDGADAVTPIVPLVDDTARDGWPNAIVDGVLTRPELRVGVLNSPHGIAVDGAGDVYLTEFVLGGRQLRLTLD